MSSSSILGDSLLLLQNSKWSPNHHPAAWFWINAACLAASLVLVADILVCWWDGEPELRPVAAALYLFYNVTTTLVWCFEIGWTAWEQQQTTTTRSKVVDDSPSCMRLLHCHGVTWPVRIELVLAVVFLVDSVRLLWEWRLRKDDLEANLWEALLNALAYLYVAYGCWSRQKKRRDFVDLEAGLVQNSLLESPAIIIKPSSLHVPLATPA